MKCFTYSYRLTCNALPQDALQANLQRAEETRQEQAHRARLGRAPQPPKKFGLRSKQQCVAVGMLASRASVLYLAARTRSRAAVRLHAAHIAALRGFWTEWLVTVVTHGNSVLTTKPRAQDPGGQSYEHFAYKAPQNKEYMQSFCIM